MKIIMYHYIRKKSEDYPNLKFLHFNKFKKQIAKFQTNSIITTDLHDDLKSKTFSIPPIQNPFKKKFIYMKINLCIDKINFVRNCVLCIRHMTKDL